MWDQKEVAWLDLVSKADVQAFQTVFRGFSPWQPQV
jgi:hypothetical protein